MKKISIFLTMICTIHTTTFTNQELLYALKLATMLQKTPQLSAQTLLDQEQQRIAKNRAHQKALQETMQQYDNERISLGKKRTQEIKDLHESFKEGKKKAKEDTLKREAAAVIQKIGRGYINRSQSAKAQKTLDTAQSEYMKEKEAEVAILKRDYYQQLATWEQQHKDLLKQTRSPEQQLSLAFYYTRQAFKLRDNSSAGAEILNNVIKALEVLIEKIENPMFGKPYAVIKKEFIGINNSELKIQLLSALESLNKLDKKSNVTIKLKETTTYSINVLIAALKHTGYYDHTKKWEYVLAQ